MADYITSQQLEDAGACQHQVSDFKKRFRAGRARVTIARAKALADVYDWRWAARHLLPAPARRAYMAATAPARRAYEAASKQARQDFNSALAEAWKAYDAAGTAEALHAVSVVTAQGWQAYYSAVAPARQALNQAEAESFARAYLGS